MSLRNLEKTVGEYITKVHTLVYDNQSIEEAIEELRKKEIHDKILYFYVVDEKERLVGVISARDLLLNSKSTSIKTVMNRGVITLRKNQSLHEAMKLLETKNLLAIPVLDEEDRFIGIIDINHYIEEAIDVANAQQRLQTFQMLGFFLEEGKKSSAWHSYKSRMPWIFCNMLGGIGCAIISAIYHVVLSKVIILAMFFPLVLSLSESISMQAMTQNLNVPIHKKLLATHPLKSVFKQWKLFVMLALTCGIIVGVISILWGDGLGPPIVISIAIMISVVLTAFVGAMVPVLLQSKKLDPKVASGPVVLMAADILTTVIYLSMAYFLLI